MDTQTHAPAPQPGDLPREGETTPPDPRPLSDGLPSSPENLPISPESPSDEPDPLALASDEIGRFGTQNANPLSPKQLLALPIVAASPSLAAGARAAGIARSTLNRWMEDHRFRAELERARQSAVELAYTEVQALALKAVSALAALIEDPNPRVRASAVRTYLQHLRRIEADRNLQQRLDILTNAYDLIQAQR